MSAYQTNKSSVCARLDELKKLVADEVSNALVEDSDPDKAGELVELVKLLEEFRERYTLLSDSNVPETQIEEDLFQSSPGTKTRQEQESAAESKKEEEFPLYGLEKPGGEIYKVGYGKNGRYVHRASRENFRRVIRHLERLRRNGDIFTTSDLYDRAGTDIAKSQLYVILGLLQQEGFIDKPKRGKYRVTADTPLTEEEVESRAQVLPEEYRE